MSYKSVLVQVDGIDPIGPRVEIAVGIALAEEAHLIGAAPATIGAEQTPATASDPGSVEPAPAIAEGGSPARLRADAALDRFDDMARRNGVASFERRLIEGDPATGFSLQGRYADLLVLGQNDGRSDSPAPRADFLEYVVINCARPVLVVPATGNGGPVGSRVLIGWNAGVAAARAVRDAVPFLIRAKQVHVVIINADPDVHGEEPGADIALYLARHGINVEVVRQTVDADAGRTLLSMADRLSCDLLVMGCVAHMHTRSLLLGGATRTVLQSTHIPVLMSH